jgi:hypothetical protein
MAMALVCGGCAAAALSLVPMGVSAVSAVGDGVMNAATNSTGSKDLHPGEDEVDRRERCDNLTDTAPIVIELRRQDSGAQPQWRELQIVEASGEPRWAPSKAADGEGHWQPSVNLLTMDFAPPLALPSGSDVPTYLSYAPSEPASATEQDELTGLTANFGAPVGTFRWNGRMYQYATAAKLPCFPPSVALK